MSFLTGYTCAELLKMKPGTLFRGLEIQDRNHALAPAWKVYPGIYESRMASGIFHVPTCNEYIFKWKTRLIPYQTIHPAHGVSLYTLSVDELQPFLSEPGLEDQVLNFTRVTKVLEFKYNGIIGMFLGHVIQAGPTLLTNILSNEGFEVWI